MKRLLISFIAILLLISVVQANDYVETFDQVSDRYMNSVHNAEVIRRINGGTVIIPEFDSSCPIEMKGPFSHACKIIEEYMYPCLPLRINVSCESFSGSNSNSISKIIFRTEEDFGENSDCRNDPMSMIKGVILAELNYGMNPLFLKFIPDVAFLTSDPDIEIIYNKSMLDEMSYSLDPVSEEKYDFISVAMRDILKGLGLTSGYRYNPITNALEYPTKKPIPFEININKNFENIDDPVERLNIATQGGLIIGNNSTWLTLYAPNPWENGKSLNYFFPQDDSIISQLLSYDFCKGMAFRSISDGYYEFFFRNTLFWKANFVTSVEKPGSYSGSSASGSTSSLMPFNGTISFDPPSDMIYYSNNDKANNNDNSNNNSIIRTNSYDNPELNDYIYSFRPFLFVEGEYTGDTGVSVCLLKKDGFWDIVDFIPYYETGMTFDMNDWTLNYDDEEYARTMDGYLRARITIRYINNYGNFVDAVRYFVVDYLPQKVNLTGRYNFQISNQPKGQISTESSTPVKLYFSDIEGLDRLVLERLREGSRVPSRIEVEDFRKGYYETTIDKTTTFTAVGYNNNGISRSVPVTIQTFNRERTTQIIVENDKILIDDIGEATSLKYDIIPLNIAAPALMTTTLKDSTIDISELSHGLYILNIYDESNNKIGEYKFSK